MKTEIKKIMQSSIEGLITPFQSVTGMKQFKKELIASQGEITDLMRLAGRAAGVSITLLASYYIIAESSQEKKAAYMTCLAAANTLDYIKNTTRK